MAHPGKAAALDVERLRAWSHARQGLGHQGVDASRALAEVVGVYSAHPSAPLSLWARCRTLTASDFAALETDRRALRIVGIRGSAFLVSAHDADRIVSATRTPLRASYLRGRGLDEVTYERLKPLVLDALRQPSTPTALRAALNDQAGGADPYFAMRAMAREGLVVRVGTGRVRTDDVRWVATEAWLGHPLGTTDAATALAWLAGAYLRAFGPARVVDFAWWAGVTGRQAAAAVAGADVIDLGAGWLLPAALARAWERPSELDPDTIDVLPKWDPFTMGYAPDGRGRFVADADRPRAYSTRETKVGATSGDGLPLILRGGRAIATWSHRLDGERMRVAIAPFEATHESSLGLLDQVAGEFAGIGRLLAANVDLSVES